METWAAPDPALAHTIANPDLPAPIDEGTQYRYVNSKSMEWVTLTIEQASGSWMHPTKGYGICGGRNSTYNVSDVPDPAHTPLCMQRSGMKTAHPGVGRCSVHGGNLPNNSKRGVEILRDLRIRQQMLSLGRTVDINPTDALLHLVSEAAGNVAFLGGRVSELGMNLVGPIYSLSRDGTPIETSEEVRALVRLYNDERDRLMKVSKVALDSGIAEREVKLQEDQAMQVVTMLQNVLSGLGLDATTISKARVLLGAEFRRLDAVTIEGTSRDIGGAEE